MKIKAVELKKLFDIDGNDYRIEFTPEKYISVLYSLNGDGKTTLFKLIDAALGTKLSVLDSILFESLKIIFEDSVLTVKREVVKKFDDITIAEIPNDGGRYYFPIFYEWEDNQNQKEVQKYFFNDETNKRITSAIEQDKKDKHFFINPNTYEQLYLKNFFIYTNLIMDPIEMIGSIVPKYECHLLFSNRDYGRYAEDYAEKKDDYQETVNLFKNFDSQVSLKINYEEARTIMETRFCEIQTMGDVQIDFLGDLINDREYDKEIKYVSFPLKDKIQFLEEKMKELVKKEDVQDCIEKYENIINKKSGLTNKDIEIDGNTGEIKIKLVNSEKTLSLTQLSSGEKNLLLLYFEIIFLNNSCKEKLLLIDEPEVSLHAEWCSEIIDNILPICEERNLQIIFATHSPDFIAKDHFDMVTMFSKE